MSGDDKIINKKALNLIYRSYEKKLEVRDMDINTLSTQFLNKMRCIELIDFIKIQESKSFSFNIQIVFDSKYNLDLKFFETMLFSQDNIHVIIHGLADHSELYLITTPIYLLKFQINPLIK